MSVGRVVGLQRSGGGVPKLPIERAEVQLTGIVGDWQRDRRYHGGPDRALCLYSAELIGALRVEGHPVWPGAMGENVTIEGLDWAVMQPGARLRIGTVVLEITNFAPPCNTISGAFTDGRFKRASEKVHPGWSRVYARIIREGVIVLGDQAELLSPELS
ncbi:MAG: domain containing protein [Gemmatimonadetes bacterium]|nr:domain containing protein [Gemmatimonadota bacterium]